MDFSSIYSKGNRKRFLLAAAILIVAIAFVDWRTKPFISIGFLYLFRILLVAGFLPRWQISIVALVCAVLQELFSELPSNEAITQALDGLSGICRDRPLCLRSYSESPDDDGSSRRGGNANRTPQGNRRAVAGLGGE